MATFEELKQKAFEAAEVIADVSVDLYRKAESKTKEFARTAKLQAENASDRTAVKKLYMEIGKLYYETHMLFPEPEFEQDCANVALLLERIEKRQAEIDALRADDTNVEDAADDDDESDEECGGGCEQKEESEPME